MKRGYFNILLVAACLFALLAGGCAKDRPTPPGPDERRQVIIDGRLAEKKVETRAAEDPVGGLPAEQLSVGIVTVTYDTSDPRIYQPDLTAWQGTSANFRRGFFGGPGLGASPVTDGEIQFTNADGTVLQRVFYDNSGEHYFARVCYPFVDGEGNTIAHMEQSPDGAQVVISGLNGSQDVMCSNLVWGNVTTPSMDGGTWTDWDPDVTPLPDPNTNTWQPSDGVVLSHMFSQFRIKLKAESQLAAVQFGQILDFELRFQPAAVHIHMLDLSMGPHSDVLTNYPMVDSGLPQSFYTTTDPLDLDRALREAKPGTYDTRNPDGTLIAAAASPLNAGYVMALPASTFRFEALTADHMWVYAEVNFGTDIDPYLTSGRGTVYDVTITFMESHRLEIEVTEVENKYLDSVFD